MYSIGFDIFAKDHASDVFDRLSDKTDKTGGHLAALKDKAKLAMAAAGVAMVSFSMQGVRSASELSETMNKASVIFGANAEAMDRWASSAATSVGMSKGAALEAATGFGNMFAQLGFAGDQAALMSREVVQLAADLGSFNNLSTDEVSDMMSAAFRGEYDSLQRLIPSINATRVEKEALAATGKKSAAELTAQEKAAATLAIVQRDGAAAAGDFARTSDGLANRQKILAATVDDLQAKIGAGLLPVMAGLVGAVLGVTNFISDNIAVMGPLLAMVGAVIAAVKTWTVVQGILNVVMKDNPVGAIVVVIAALVAGLVAAYQSSETFRAVVDVALSAVGGYFTFLWNNIVSNVLKLILYGFDKIVGGIATFLHALGKIPGFGWAEDAARAMDAAGDKARDLADGIQQIKSKTVDVAVNYRVTGSVQAAQDARLGTRGFASGGSNISPGWAWVGESGPELMWIPSGSTVVPADRSREMASGSIPGGASQIGAAPVTVKVYLGNEELTDRVRVVVREEQDAQARGVLAGVW